jgi:DNA-binding response OmpR family regulator
MENKKILLVDDDRATLRITQVMLEHHGFTVLTAPDGQSALDLVKNENPDLVLTDALIPKIHGFVLAKTIKKLPHPPKVILLTGVYTKQSYRYEALSEYEVDDYLKKPISDEDLLACIKKHLSLP